MTDAEREFERALFVVDCCIADGIEPDDLSYAEVKHFIQLADYWLIEDEA